MQGIFPFQLLYSLCNFGCGGNDFLYVLFVKNGPVTKFFSLLGLENVSWFASTKYALAFLIIVYVWQQIGFYMVIFIGGLQEVPVELYEAAKVDGVERLAAAD